MHCVGQFPQRETTERHLGWVSDFGVQLGPPQPVRCDELGAEPPGSSSRDVMPRMSWSMQCTVEIREGV